MRTQYLSFALLLALALVGCGGSDGPAWAESEGDGDSALAQDSATPTPDADPILDPDAAPVIDPDAAPPVVDPDAALPKPDAAVVEPTGSLELQNVWGHGLQIQVDELSWKARDEIRFRLGLSDPVTGETISSVNARNFQFSEDGLNLGGEALFTVDRAKELRVVLVLDVSQSMTEAGAMEPLRRGARALYEALPREAKVAIVAFSTDYQVLCNFTSDASTVHAAIDRLAAPEGRAGRFTNLWGAVTFATSLFGPSDGGRALVVFTDGRDNVAETELGPTIQAIQDASISAYAIGLGAELDVESLRRLAGPSRFTGTTEPAALTAVFAEIAGQLGELLTVDYVTPKRRGTHTLSVTISVEELSAGFDVLFTLP